MSVVPGKSYVMTVQLQSSEDFDQVYQLLADTQVKLEKTYPAFLKANLIEEQQIVAFQLLVRDDLELARLEHLLQSSGLIISSVKIQEGS